MSDRIDLSELLRNPQEIRDLLSAYGEPPSRNDEADRQRLMEITNQLGEARLINTLFHFARGFARMLEEVLNFCEEKGVRILGQIQVKGEEDLAEATSLQTTWARGEKQLRSDDFESRAHALAAELSGLAQSLDPDALIRSESRETETPEGRAMRQSSDPRQRLYYELRLPGLTHRHEHYDAFSQADLDALRSAHTAIQETQGFTAGAGNLGEIQAAMDEVDARLEQMLESTRGAKPVDDKDPSPSVMSLASQLYLIAMQWRLLAEEASEGKRVQEGFAEFVRSEFWQFRWRIYELWLLVRVLRVLEAGGGRLTLKSVQNGLWRLPYGHSLDPVVVCEFSSGTLQVFYQYWREDENGADMPDLVVSAPDERPVLVLDPKHGATYSRGELVQVLDRYARNLKADITAVANYFAKTYPFQDVRWDTRQWILASNVAPGTTELQRLELRFAEALLARGYRPAPALAEIPAREKPGRQAARASLLLYWASKQREVDEPPGPWVLNESGSIQRVSGLAEALGVEENDVVSIDASRDGEACVIRMRKKMGWLLPRKKPRFIEAESGYSDIFAGWNGTGTHYAFDNGTTTQFFDREGNRIGDIPVPSVNKDEDPWGTDRKCLGWSTDGRRLLRADKNDDGELFIHASTDFKSWARLLVIPESSGYMTDEKYWRIRGGTQDRTTVGLGSFGEISINSNGEVQKLTAETTSSEALSESPSGTYRVESGPVSVRRQEGVHLLRFVDQRPDSKPLPFVRFFGELNDVPAWSADESRLAFFVRGDRKAGHNPEDRLFIARLGDRHALPVSLPGQRPRVFAWISPALLRQFVKPAKD